MRFGNLFILLSFLWMPIELLASNLICKTLTPITLDGQNIEWVTDSPCQITNLLEGSINAPADLGGAFQAVYDDNYLYLFVKISDDVLVNDSQTFWQDDGIEIYIDGGNEKSTAYDANDHQLFFGVNDSIIYYPSGPQNNPVGVEMVQVITTDGYQMEIRISWTFIGVNPNNGQAIGIEVHANDDDVGGGRDAKIAWHNTVLDIAWNDPTTFGTMALGPDCQGANGTPSPFKTGVTFTQHSLDSWGNPIPIANGKALMDNSSTIVNQHVMGFGALNPELYPDVYDFSTIASRIGNTNGAGKDAEIIVLTACCAPDWMKGGQAGNTDWSNIEGAPFPAFYDDYAQLVKEIVEQPEFSNVKYIQVWNEMKGMWNNNLNRWDYEGYTELYNHVWDSVKLVRPDIKIGGPYVSLSTYGGPSFFASDVGGAWGKFDFRDLDVIEYWLVNKRGADFLTIDGWNINFKDNINPVDQFEHTKMFADFTTWFRTLDTLSNDASTLPVWWAEWYAMPRNANASQAEKNALMAIGLIHTIKSGAETALIWGPQGDVNGNYYPLGLFSDTRVVGGGVATPFYQTQQDLHDHFSCGVPLIDLVTSNGSIELIASCSKVMLVNKSNSLQTTQIEGVSFTLNPFEVRTVNTPGTPCNTSRLVEIDLQFYLEGPFDLTLGNMENRLQQLSLLPSGQPYSIPPWNYFGIEGAGWSNNDYPVGSIDWVLVSFRTTEQPSSEMGKVAALLLENGSLFAPVELLIPSSVSALYVVVEHRNHLPVMSAQPIPILNNSISYNFSGTSGYLGAGFGQKQLSNGEWVLHSSNADQSNPAGYEITGADKLLWDIKNGGFNSYQVEDFNLDGDVNGADRILWNTNNGVSSGIIR